MFSLGSPGSGVCFLFGWETGLYVRFLLVEWILVDSQTKVVRDLGFLFSMDCFDTWSSDVRSRFVLEVVHWKVLLPWSNDGAGIILVPVNFCTGAYTEVCFFSLRGILESGDVHENESVECQKQLSFMKTI